MAKLVSSNQRPDEGAASATGRGKGRGGVLGRGPGSAAGKGRGGALGKGSNGSDAYSRMGKGTFARPAGHGQPTDYAALPPLDTEPCVGDVLAYKVLELSENSWAPEVSDFKVLGPLSCLLPSLALVCFFTCVACW